MFLQIEIPSKSLWAKLANMLLDPKMWLYMVFEVDLLTKWNITVRKVTFEWFLFCMTHHMSVEFTHALDNLVTNSVTIWILVTAFKQAIFLFYVILFLDEIEYKLFTFGNKPFVPKLSWVEVTSIYNNNFRIWLNIMDSHELIWKSFLTFLKFIFWIFIL